MNLVQAAERALPGLAVVSILDHQADDQVSVVVPLLGTGGELVGRVEQRPDRRHRVGAEERAFERTSRVEGELVASDQMRDPLVVRDGVETQDLLEIRGHARHALKMTGRTGGLNTVE